MSFPPVIQRELTAVSRRPDTWRLRLVYGVGALGAFGFGMLLPHIGANERGQVVLLCLAICGFVLSLLAGPYLTADCVSSEKREGTLGLLFLTPLNGWHIILGKMVTHSAQVGYALVGVFPMFFLPLLLGGVLWSEVTRVALVLVLTMLLSLALGMFWSTVSTEARTAILATIVTLFLLALLPLAVPFLGRMITQRPFPVSGPPQFSPIVALVFAFEENFRSGVAPVPGAFAGSRIFWGCVGISLASSLTLIFISGWLLSRLWRRAEAAIGGPGGAVSFPAKPSKPLRAKAVPNWASTFERPLVWLAARNLGEPRWFTLIRFGIVAFFASMLFLSVTTQHWREGYISAFCAAYVCHFLARIQLSLAGTRRLHEDRRNGALEALLATPVTDAEFISAHHVALKRVFRASLITLLVLNGALQLAAILFPKQLHMDGGAGSIFSVFWIGGALVTLADFATLRWLTLREALRTAASLKAAGRAYASLNLIPWLTFALAFVVAVQNSEEEGAVIFALWAGGCLLYNWLLR
jgi:hypothetical protein